LGHFSRSIAVACAASLLLAAGCSVNPDVNHDGVVDIFDISLVASCLGQDPQANLQCTAADVDGDGDVDQYDFDYVVAFFGVTGFPVADRTAPVVAIDSPANLTRLNTDPVLVRGTVDDPDATVTVNGVPAPLSGSPPSFAVDLALHEGENLITVTAVDLANNIGTATVSVSLDTRPPRVTIDSPPDGSVTTAATVEVAGMINDIVAGTVNAGQAQVSVNGVPALVANRSFLATAVPIAPGVNVITAIGTDEAGNIASASIEVTREETMSRAEIRIVSGNGQSAPIGAPLAEQAVVELVDETGAPIANKTVVFRVMENDGTVDDGVRRARAVTVTSDAQGLAQVVWFMGQRSGVGNNRLRATAVGCAGMADFLASGLPGSAARIVPNSGGMQTGIAGQKLPRPFTAVVIDPGDNRLPGVPVTFSVVRGGGAFDGAESLTVATDGNGVAAAILTLGPGEGSDNNWATVDFVGNTTADVTFVASARVAGPPADTSVSGVVLDNADVPIPGVTLHIEGTSLFTQSDAQGQFAIAGAPVGTILLVADGSTAAVPGVWPTLEFELVTIAGRDNGIGMPIYLLPIDTANVLCVDETTGGTLTLPQVPGFSLTIAPGTATFRDGTKSGCVSVTTVHPDRIPMPPNFGQQPTFIVTIQPAGVLFEPPAPVAIPNSDALPPGRVTELYSFDHDLGSFVSIGTGTVSEDGTVIESDPGVGIIKAGWHCGGDPASLGLCEHECDDGNDCTVPGKLVGNMCAPPQAVEDGKECRTGLQDFTFNGVNGRIGDSCKGSCSGTSCEDRFERTGIANLLAATEEALDKIFNTECISDENGLRTKLQEGLTKLKEKNKGLYFTCPDKSDLNADGKDDCASAPVGESRVTISNVGFALCPNLAKTVFHEILHGVGEKSHVGLEPSEDAIYGCELACFEFSHKEDADRATCK
jgi:hypothetical protein